MGKAVVLINSISDHPLADELDVLVQADQVQHALQTLGYETERMFFDLNLLKVKELLENYSPSLVFNLVETVGNKGELIHFAPSLLESMNMAFTGSGSFPIYLSSHKILAKKRFADLGIPSPEWCTDKNAKFNPNVQYILKPVWEDGSIGITDNSVASGRDIITGSKEENNFFFEEYIPGREFNISILSGDSGPQILPPAEIRFVDYPEGKPHILNYASKWDESSFEYHNSLRSFSFEPKDDAILKQLSKISLLCWMGLGLNGYARVDFRVDKDNKPFVLEVNANPCISPDAGFIAAAREAGISYLQVIDRICKAAFMDKQI
jgi:D-alanine-D-alanine ligase